MNPTCVAANPLDCLMALSHSLVLLGAEIWMCHCLYLISICPQRHQPAVLLSLLIFQPLRPDHRKRQGKQIQQTQAELQRQKSVQYREVPSKVPKLTEYRHYHS